MIQCPFLFWPLGSSELNSQPNFKQHRISWPVYLCIILPVLSLFSKFLIYLFLFCWIISILIKSLHTLVMRHSIFCIKSPSSPFHSLNNLTMRNHLYLKLRFQENKTCAPMHTHLSCPGVTRPARGSSNQRPSGPHAVLPHQYSGGDSVATWLWVDTVLCYLSWRFALTGKNNNSTKIVTE